MLSSVHMPLSWNEIRARAAKFALEWVGVEKESEAYQVFWHEFLEVFGVSGRSVAVYQKKVENLPSGIRERGYIDLYWPGVLVVEHKSKGKDLDSAYAQATDYILGLKERERPRYVIVSDYALIRLYDLDAGPDVYFEFSLSEFPKEVRRFGFIAGYVNKKYEGEDPVNVKAAELVAKLHDALRGSGYEGEDLQLFLVRIVFCFFADDTGIFNEKDVFLNYIENRTSEDGSDFGGHMSELFQTLATPAEKRQRTLDEDLAAFPHVDGHLFEKTIRIPAFDAETRQRLIDCAKFDWSGISPAVFGALFQSVMDQERRHDLGAHYTSEKNIMKVIGGLFLDDLKKELDTCGMDGHKLRAFHAKIAKIRYLDPACGCGNFLVVAYRELRLMETEVLKRLFPAHKSHIALPPIVTLVKIDVDSASGIEIEEFPARIAELAMWLTDHQMNLKLSDAIGAYHRRLPLTKKANIVKGDALEIDWGSVLDKESLTYIFGNPPFLGSKVMSDAHRAQISALFGNAKGAGELDFVTGWYEKASEFIKGTGIETAFVSTNSITQGQQVGVLWGRLLKKGVVINFAHRTFKWSNEARHKAAVYCVIIGFACHDAPKKLIYEYESPTAEPLEIEAKRINPYLVDADDILIISRGKPISAVPEISIGNKPIDGGNYLFTPEEKTEFLKKEPRAEKYFRRWLGSDEFINGIERWCLWLGECPPEELKKMPEALKRVEAVRLLRLASKSAPTKKLAETPTRFHVENMPKSHYLVIPEVSSERRQYIPIGYVGPETLSSNLVKVVPNATLYHFGVLTSIMHMAWVRQVCGRLESRYRYSKDIVYNNFPWPEDLTDKQREAIEQAAQAVDDARAAHPKATLAELYDPLTMPKELRDAHNTLDAAVDRAYGKKGFASEMDRLRFLFERYEVLTKARA